MFPYLSAVMPQIAYAHSVREFIRELLKRFMPGKWIDRVISGSDETFDAKLEEVDRKVSTLRRGGKQRGRYTQKAKAICWSCWTAAANHEEVWRSVNTRITYKAVLDYYHARLAQVGVNDHNAFRDVVHAEVMRRNRELAMKQDTTRQKKRNAALSGNKTPPKNGKIRTEQLLGLSQP